MTELTVIGGGANLEESRRILAAAAIEVGDNVDRDTGTPVLLGETASSYATARRLVDAGRDLLICSPQLLAPSELQALLQARKPNQAVVAWDTSRHHPANRMIAGLVRTGDPAWEPRLVRSVSFGTERPTATSLAWRSLDAIALATEMVGAAPRTVSAVEAPGGERGKEDCIALSIGFDQAAAVLQVGLGEAAERRETMLAGPTRKAYVDELDQKVPLRILDADAAGAAASSRYVACTAPEPRDLARLQVLAFLESVQQRDLVADEAALRLDSLAVWRAVQASLAQSGAPQPVDELAAASGTSRQDAQQGMTARPTLRLVSR